MDGEKKVKAFKTIGIMMGATVISKLLGMLRGVLQAGAYGTLPEANAFTAASKLPLAFFDMLLAAAVMGCFIPVYNSFKEDGREGNGEADRFAGIFLNFIALICGILAVIGIVFADFFIGVIASGLSPEMHTLAVTLTRIMFPLVIFAGSAYTLVGLLQSKGSFIAPALISAISNGGVVAYLAFINPHLGDMGIYGLAVAYMLSWLLQLLTLILPLHRTGFRYRLLFDFKNPALIKALKMAPPIMVGSWLSPVGILLGQYFASRITALGGVSGAAAIFDYANNVYVIIAGTLTYSICNYTFPKIAKLSAEGRENEFYATLREGFKNVLYIVVPFCAAALVLAGEGVAVLYMRGEFTAEDAENTARTLRFILPAMPLFAVSELLTRAFYSKNKPSVVMYAVIVGIFVNLASGFLLVRSGGIFGIAAVGIAAGLGQAATSLMLIGFSVGRLRSMFNGELFWHLLIIFTGGIAAFFTALGVSTAVNSQPYTATIAENTIKAIVIFIPSVAVYLLWTYILKKIIFGKNKKEGTA